MKALTATEANALNGLLNIWASRASVALSQMTSTNIHISFARLDIFPLEKVSWVVGDPKDVVATVYIKVDGEKRDKTFPVGSLLFMYSPEGAVELSSLMQGMDVKDRESQELNEIDISALNETGNILAGACATVMGNFLEFKLIEGLPGFACDMLQAVLDNILVELALKAEDAIIFNISLSIEDHEVSAHFLILFDPEILNMLLLRLNGM